MILPDHFPVYNNERNALIWCSIFDRKPITWGSWKLWHYKEQFFGDSQTWSRCCLKSIWWLPGLWPVWLVWFYPLSQIVRGSKDPSMLATGRRGNFPYEVNTPLLERCFYLERKGRAGSFCFPAKIWQTGPNVFMDIKKQASNNQTDYF